MVQAQINHDTVEPGVKTRPAVEMLDVGEGAQKGVLRQVFRRLRIAREIESNMKGLFHITPNQNLEVILLALLTQGHQFFVADILRLNHVCPAPASRLSALIL